MAKSSTKDRSISQFPKPKTAPDENFTPDVAVTEPPAEPVTPFDDLQPIPGDPKPKKPPKILTFFERVDAIDPKDWGMRAKIKVYRLAPIINRLVGSETKFITIYTEPITEQKLKIDHGSGRYRLYLNYKAPAGQKEKELDVVELDILDKNFPPNINPGEWLDDPRNKVWAWAKPKTVDPPAAGAAAPAPASDPFAVLDTVMDLQDRIEQRIKPAEPFAPANPATAVDPWTAAEKILNMRADNPMMAILQQQMKDAAAAQEAERQRAFQAAEAARDREFKLQQQLLESQRGSAPKGLVEQLLEIATLGDKLDPLKKLLGFNGTGEGVRAAKTTALDLVRDFAESPAGTALAQGLAGLMVNLARPAPAAPAPGPIVLNAQQSNGTVAPAEDTETRIMRIGQTITQPMLYEFFLRNEPGDLFAERVFDLWPEDYAFLKQLGAANLIERYRRFTPAWNLIAPKEAQFVEFLNQFVNWNPNEDEAPAPGTGGDDGVVDLEEGK